jgi:hypothetical protein
MNDTNYIPEVIEPDTFVRGRLVPVELVRNVRRGWKAGVAYLALLLVAFVASAIAGELTTLALLVSVPEILVVAGLVWGVRRWSQLAAWLLFAHPIVSTLVLAFASQPNLQTPMGGGTLRIFLLVIFLLFFGKAAMAIRRFLRSADSDVSQET